MTQKACYSCFPIHLGSPLQYTVGKTPIGGTHRVEFGGAGAERGAIGIKSTLVVAYDFLPAVNARFTRPVNMGRVN